MAEIRTEYGVFVFQERPGWRDTREQLLRQCAKNNQEIAPRTFHMLQKGRRHEHVALAAVFAADGAVVSDAEIEAYVRAKTGETAWVMNQGASRALCESHLIGPAPEHSRGQWRCIDESAHLDAGWSAHWRSVLAGVFKNDMSAMSAAVAAGEYIAFQFVPGARSWSGFCAETAEKNTHRWTRLIRAAPPMMPTIDEDAQAVFAAILKNTQKRKRTPVAPTDENRNKKRKKKHYITKN